MSCSSLDSVSILNEILFQFSTSEDELDLSSLDLYKFPEEIFSLDVSNLKILSLDHNRLHDVSENLYKLSNLIELSLVGNNIKYLSQNVTELENLEILVLNENGLKSLPANFGDLKSLTSLSIVGNALQSLPATFIELVKLEELLLDENKLSFLPTGWSQLRSLSIFEISNNQLDSLPCDIGNLTTLTVLSCNYNQIEVLPDSFSNLKGLRILDLSNNKLIKLPDKFESANNLEKLFLENNNIDLLPNWFSELNELVELTIAENGLVTEAFTIGFCSRASQLQKLEAGSNFISSLPFNFGNLASLEIIHFGSVIPELERSNFQNGNWIKDLPDSICNLTNLKRANINENQLAALPENFGNLRQLSWLDLGQNMLEYLPKSFSSLCNLEFLQLSKNQLKFLPEDIGCLQKLVDLRLDNNLLTSIPESMDKLYNLRSLDLFHNKLKEIPCVVYKLNKLTRLDLDQNCFLVHLSEIPKILPGNRYPERDPNLKDNWRGKTRSDKLMSTNIIDINAEYDDNTSNKEEEEIQWNRKALEMAIKRGMSRWRSHNVGAVSTTAQEAIPTKDDLIMDSDYWEPVTYSILGDRPYQPGIMSYRPKSEKHIGEEDWDEEIEENTRCINVLETCSNRTHYKSDFLWDFQNTLNRYPPAKQAYSSTASYSSFVYKQQECRNTALPMSQLFIDGQFDDAE